MPEQTHLLSLCGSFWTPHRSVPGLQAWTRSTPSYCWRSLLTRVSRGWGISVWSDRLATKFHSPTSQTQNRWKLGSLPKASPNRKSTTTLIKPECGLISVNFSHFLTKTSKNDLNAPANFSWVSERGLGWSWTPFALQGGWMFGDPHRGPTLFPQQRRAEGGVRRWRQPHLLADHRAEGAGGGQSRLSCVFLGVYVNL